MANLRDIRNRIESIQNTQQITKMKEVVARLAKNADEDNQLLQQPEKTERIAFIVIGSDRGLCGAFNNNLFKEVEKRIQDDFSEYQESGNLSLICLGKKAEKHFGKRNYEIADAYPGFFDELIYSKASEIMKGITQKFKTGNYDAVYLAYNEFKSVIAQNRMIEKVLPIDPATLIDGEADVTMLIIFTSRMHPQSCRSCFPCI